MSRTRLLATLSLLAAFTVLAGCAGLPAAAPPPSPAVAAADDMPPVLVAPPAASPAPAVVHPKPVDVAAAPLQEPLSIPTDLWLRVRQGMAMPDLDDPRVAKWEAYYAARPAYVARMMERGGRYLFHIVDEVEARGLPMELALLPFIESAFNPQARSSAAAEGMWQFVPATGRAFDLRQNLLRDDRRDVIASTRAALDYLTSLHQRFDDWHLALAAYNWGQGSVSRAMKRNAARSKPTDYAALRMPEETRNYVPKLLAMKHIVMRPEAFGLTLPPLEDHPAFLAVPIERDIDVELAARLAGLDEDDFRAFNPQHAKPVILAAGTSEVLLPYDVAQRFQAALKAHPGPLASWTVWVAPRTMTPAQAAAIVGASETELRSINRIPPRMKLRAGSAIVVPRQPAQKADVAEHLAENASIALVPEAGNLRRVVLKVGKKGDSVAGVARRYRLKATDVARWNDVGVKARFRAGTKVVVMLPPKKRSTRSAGGGSSQANKPVTRTAKSKR
ncbi:transglycosylase SLT domain-containing protein [Rubrivivax albus]|uniref:Lytic transglycosylase n=1 Tax=Rubrivivax albus TaxID=2499835 RepID=A0A3S2TL47_9BURK|nr:transglycosylase SLT domain-containing protein [Rubrivivax albus]RVT50406.1 lytic transglycosylase [Rubrivivax albus]